MKSKSKPVVRKGLLDSEKAKQAKAPKMKILQFETVEPCDFWSQRQKVWNKMLFRDTEATYDQAAGVVFLVGRPGSKSIVIPLSNVNYVHLEDC